MTGSSVMRVENGLAEGEGREAELAGRGPSRRGRRRHRRAAPVPGPALAPAPAPAPAAVQRLFDVCREVFADGRPGAVPCPDDVARLRVVMDAVGPADVGLSQGMPYFTKFESKVARPPIIYIRLYECYKFSIGIFCLPKSGVIPLHNHPGMTVFSKLLFGSMHVKSYDWVDVPQELSSDEIFKPLHFQPPGVRLAKVKTNAVLTAPCETSILYPAAGGNMHCFEAMTPCAVLDVLGPPYSDLEGRHCQYYNDFPYASFAGDGEAVPGRGDGYAWLEEQEKPNDFLMVAAKYRGPKIVEY